MIEKVRNTVEELLTLGDTVKADAIQSRLKTLREDAVRQLKDKSELFVDGQNMLKFGKHHFTVNTQPLELSVVHRQDAMYLPPHRHQLFRENTGRAFPELPAGVGANAGFGKQPGVPRRIFSL